MAARRAGSGLKIRLRVEDSSHRATPCEVNRRGIVVRVKREGPARSRVSPWVDYSKGPGVGLWDKGLWRLEEAVVMSASATSSAVEAAPISAAASAAVSAAGRDWRGRGWSIGSA